MFCSKYCAKKEKKSTSNKLTLLFEEFSLGHSDWFYQFSNRSFHAHIKLLCVDTENKSSLYSRWPLAQLLSARYRCGRFGIDSRAGQIGTVSRTACHRCDVSSELCCPGAKPRRWAPQLVTRFSVIWQV